MSDFSEMRNAIQTRLNTVASIGNVLTYERWAADWATYLTRFKAAGQIKAWWMSYDRMADEPYYFAANKRTYIWHINGVLGLKDASATSDTMDDLIESVENALDGRTDLGVTNAIAFGVGPASIAMREQRMFGSVLCHYVRIDYPVEILRTLTYATG